MVCLGGCLFRLSLCLFSLKPWKKVCMYLVVDLYEMPVSASIKKKDNISVGRLTRVTESKCNICCCQIGLNYRKHAQTGLGLKLSKTKCPHSWRDSLNGGEGWAHGDVHQPQLYMKEVLIPLSLNCLISTHSSHGFISVNGGSVQSNQCYCYQTQQACFALNVPLQLTGEFLRMKNKWAKCSSKRGGGSDK